MRRLRVRSPSTPLQDILAHNPLTATKKPGLRLAFFGRRSIRRLAFHVHESSHLLIRLVLDVIVFRFELAGRASLTQWCTVRRPVNNRFTHSHERSAAFAPEYHFATPLLV